jgi:hypothetical protein
LDFSAAGNLSSFEQSLFTPTTLSNAAAVPSTFEQFASGLLAGKFAGNPQLGAALSSSPLLVESPISNLIYGERMFTSTAHASLAYSHSPRLTLTFSGGGSRSQHISGGQAQGAATSVLVPNTTSATAGVAISYSVSPFTQIGGTATTVRNVTQLQDSFITTSLATLGHSMGMHWVFQAHGGIGVTNTVHQTSVVVPTKPEPAVGGSIAYKTFSHTFLGSYDRTVSDSYGLGASTSSTANATWRWLHPGSSWGLSSSFGWQQLQGGILNNTSGWRVSVGLNRAVGSHIILVTEYAHQNVSGQSAQVAAYNASQDAVRFSISWSPRPTVFR